MLTCVLQVSFQRGCLELRQAPPRCEARAAGTLLVVWSMRLCSIPSAKRRQSPGQLRCPILGTRSCRKHCVTFRRGRFLRCFWYPEPGINLGPIFGSRGWQLRCGGYAKRAPHTNGERSKVGTSVTRQGLHVYCGYCCKLCVKAKAHQTIMWTSHATPSKYQQRLLPARPPPTPLQWDCLTEGSHDTPPGRLPVILYMSNARFRDPL